MKSRNFLLLFLVASSVHGGWKQMTQKYEALKTMIDCFGEEFMVEQYRNHSEALQYCQALTPDSFLRDLPLSELSLSNPSSVSQSSPFRPLTGDSPKTQFFDFSSGALSSDSPPTGVVNLNNLFSTLQNNFSQPLLLVPLPYTLLQEIAHLNAGSIYIRKKRQTQEPIFNRDKINESYRKIQAKAGNFTCVVKRLGLFNAAFDVNVLELMNSYNNMNLDPELRSDINEGIMDCLKFSTCKPLNRMSLIPPSIQRAMTFLKCEAKQRAASCIKSDIKRMSYQFDLEALGNIAAGSNIDEADKMIAIMFGEFMMSNF